MLARALLDGAGMDPAAADADLDLVALATVADCVPLVGENRRLVREGLRALASTRKPGLQALMEVARVDPSGLDASAIGFRLAPRINAAGRLHRADAGLELLLTADVQRARAVAAELDSINAERRDVETRILFDAEKQVAETPAGAPAYVLAADGWHPGVIGIVASRIAERHHRPAVLIALDGDEGTGSGRSIPAFDLLAGLHAAGADLLRYGGHRAAAGLTIRRERVDTFRETFVSHAAATLTPADLVPVQRVDAVVPGDALHLGLAEELERLAPFGIGNPEPALLVPSALLDDPRPMGEGRHVSFSLAAGGARSRCVAFGRGGSLPAAPREPVDAAVRLEISRYNGAVEPRLVLRHAQPARPAPIEVVGEPQFDAGILAELDRDLTAWRTDRDERAARRLGRAGVADHDGGSRPAGRGGVADHDDDSTCSPAGVDFVGDDLRGAADGLGPPRRRAVRDARDGGIAGLLGDLVASGAPVLAITAHACQRAIALRDRVGGFAVTTWAALEQDPLLAITYTHVVIVDPPPHVDLSALADDVPGDGWTHLAWGGAEIELARRVLAWELDLRPQLAGVYRALRDAAAAPPPVAIGRDDLVAVGSSAAVTGSELDAILRGSGAQPRSGAVAGRLLRVLSELGLVAVATEPLAVTVPVPSGRTDLDRSPAFRAYAERLRDGLAFLAEPVRIGAPAAAEGRSVAA
jgi:single-stranded-DNA-specific exonuclease